jgi:hypothetical protein
MLLTFFGWQFLILVVEWQRHCRWLGAALQNCHVMNVSFIFGFGLLILDDCTLCFSLPDIIPAHYSLSNWSILLTWSLCLYWSLQTTEIAYEICEVLIMVSRPWCCQRGILLPSLGSKKSSTLTYWLLKMEVANSSEMSVTRGQCCMKQLKIYIYIYILYFPAYKTHLFLQKNVT